MGIQLVHNLTQVQMVFCLKKGDVVAFSDPAFNLAREEDGMVAVYIYPLWLLPVLGNRVFYRQLRTYDWLNEHHPLIQKSLVCRGMELEEAPCARGIYAIIVRMVCAVNVFWERLSKKLKSKKE